MAEQVVQVAGEAQPLLRHGGGGGHLFTRRAQLWLIVIERTNAITTKPGIATNVAGETAAAKPLCTLTPNMTSATSAATVMAASRMGSQPAEQVAV